MVIAEAAENASVQIEKGGHVSTLEENCGVTGKTRESATRKPRNWGETQAAIVFPGDQSRPVFPAQGAYGHSRKLCFPAEKAPQGQSARECNSLSRLP
jgi:hypothetical protein